MHSVVLSHFREPDRAPLKVHRQVRQLIRQSNTFLFRHLALHLLQECGLDRVGVRLVRRFAFLSPAFLLLGVREGHAGR